MGYRVDTEDGEDYILIDTDTEERVETDTPEELMKLIQNCEDKDEIDQILEVVDVSFGMSEPELKEALKLYDNVHDMVEENIFLDSSDEPRIDLPHDNTSVPSAICESILMGAEYGLIHGCFYDMLVEPILEDSVERNPDTGKVWKINQLSLNQSPKILVGLTNLLTDQQDKEWFISNWEECIDKYWTEDDTGEQDEIREKFDRIIVDMVTVYIEKLMKFFETHEPF
jgi:hypothetical protein